MGSTAPAMDKLNLICYSCGYQFVKADLRSFSTVSFQSFASDFVCPNCDGDIHPEDALFKYFNEIPTAEITGRPTMIGGFASVGTKSLNLGKTEEVGLIGAGGLDIDTTLLAETDQPPGQTISDLQGVQFEWYPGPILVDDEVVVDLRQTSETEVGFITSLLQIRAWPVTIGYLIHAHRSEIPQPPWVNLLSEAINHYHQGHGLAMYSLLFSAFESHISREILRTQAARGRTSKSVEGFLNNHHRFKELCKDAIQIVTGKHFPTEKPNLYRELLELRKTRNKGIIHVDPRGSVAPIGVQDLRDAVETIAESSIAINRFCHQTRLKYI